MNTKCNANARKSAFTSPLSSNYVRVQIPFNRQFRDAERVLWQTCLISPVVARVDLPKAYGC